MLAIAVTVVATLVVVALLASAAYLVRAARDLRRQAEALAKEAGELLAEMRSEANEASAEVERVERLVGSAEAISDAVGQASRLVSGVMAAPLIKLVAFGAGVSQAFRSLGSGRTAVKPVPRRRRARRRTRALSQKTGAR